MTSSEPSELTATTKRNGTTSTNSTDQLKSDDKQHNKKNALMKFKSYLIALRVWSLSASIIPTILGKLPTCHTLLYILRSCRIVLFVSYHTIQLRKK